MNTPVRIQYTIPSNSRWTQCCPSTAHSWSPCPHQLNILDTEFIIGAIIIMQ